jgi:tripartite-type tricarboxylate transporter receptor subunit TctC
VVVENRPGAAGTIGLNAVAKAPPDGYTLGILDFAYIVAPSLIAKMPYDTERDLTAVSLIARQSNLLVVPSSFSVKSVAELIAAAKAKPGFLKFASGGNGTPAHLAGELFKREAGVDIVHIPYKGAPAGATALLAGDVDMMFGANVVVSPHITSGKLRALATVAPRRIPTFPDVPTLAELGYVAVSPWGGVVAPTGTPKEVVTRLRLAIQKIGTMEEIQQRFAAIGMQSADAGPEEFAAFIQTELQRWNKLMRDAGIKPD